MHLGRYRSRKCRRTFCQNHVPFICKGHAYHVSSGALKPIEELEVGEKIFTRDKGVQEIRWIGQSTMHATGDFAPFVIKASALNNMHDLVVSP
ncbi:MAG: hypothetical protein EBX06_00690 [Rhodobacteraceae bacterium]|nr:hypothetical protein [Paracoccaceae bacterium]NCV69090.1 hypothetical protein [Paracoccaceae bacterium]NCW03946.1 hypothetical protein [Paracoccaceae bacterium]NCW60973.1 hypothetical protein [Paracoccaceae bacterium]NCW65140.1 hypothetical protein [Paracoccaceae bacterium]